ELEEVQPYYVHFEGFGVTALPDGGFAVVWAETYAGASDFDSTVRLQRFDANGSASGNELTLYQGTDSQLTTRFSQPAVASDEEGDLVVAWTTPGDNCFGDLFFQTLEADGDWSNLPDPTRVTEEGCDPRLAMDADGDFALTWRERDPTEYQEASARLRTYSANGTAFQVSDIVLARDSVWERATPALAMQRDGEFMVAWETEDDDYNLYSQRYNLNGTTRYATPQRLDNGMLNPDYDHIQINPALEPYGDDGFIAFWEERQEYLAAEDANKFEIKGLRWHADLTPGKALTAGEMLTSDDYNLFKQSSPALAVDSDGNAIVAWQGQEDEQKPQTSLTLFDDRLSIVELEQPFIDPETLNASSVISHPPQLVMTDEQTFLVWVQVEDDQPHRLVMRTLPSLVEADIPVDEDNATETGGSSGSGGGAGSPWLLGLVALLGIGRWMRRH
ncbi:MAG TPA: hypothetical protein VFN16_03925, partial [Saccharospirillum sp.]|nr:hypothetical protein [Saccharospirillum sp.]